MKPRKVDWSAGDWLNGTRRLTNEQRGVYVTACCLIYDLGGPVSRRELNRECIGNSRSMKRIVDSLIELGKLTLTERGLIDQPRCERELKIARKRLEGFRKVSPNIPETLPKVSPKHVDLGQVRDNENNDLAAPTRARSKGEAKEEELDLKNTRGLVGRSAPAKAEPGKVRDPVARNAAIEVNKFRRVYATVNAAAARLCGAEQWEAWRLAAAAESAGSWEAMPVGDRQKLRDLWRWTKTINKPEGLAA